MASFAYPDGYAVVRLARELGIPSGIQVLGSDINLLDQFPDRAHGTWEALDAAQVVLPVSEALARKIRERGIPAERVKVIYRGVDSETFTPGPQADARTRLRILGGNPMLLFVGNLVPIKSVQTLIAACPSLLLEFPRLKCHIIGSGPLRRRLGDQVKSLGLDDTIYFEGTVEHSVLPDWYRAANLVVLPSLNEGVPNVLLESIASGTPYVASRTGGIPEISSHRGCRLAEPGNVADFERAIKEMLQDGRRPHARDLRTSNWHDAGKKLGEALEFAIKP